MAYKLSIQERQALDALASGFTERETYLNLGIPQNDFGRMWQRIREEFETNQADDFKETHLRHAFHRVERRRLEAELWASEARLAALMDTAPEPILLINGRTGRIERVNNQAILMLGYTMRELIGREMEMLVPDDLKQIHVSYRQGFLNSVRKREMGYHPPIKAVCKDGRELSLDIALTATAATDDVMVVCKPSLVQSEGLPADEQMERGQ